MDGNLNVLKGDREPMYYIDIGEIYRLTLSKYETFPFSPSLRTEIHLVCISDTPNAKRRIFADHPVCILTPLGYFSSLYGSFSALKNH